LDLLRKFFFFGGRTEDAQTSPDVLYERGTEYQEGYQSKKNFLIARFNYSVIKLYSWRAFILDDRAAWEVGWGKRFWSKSKTKRPKKRTKRKKEEEDRDDIWDAADEFWHDDDEDYFDDSPDDEDDVSWDLAD